MTTSIIPTDEPLNDLRATLARALGSGYRVERELGGGGMSRVFVAEEVALERRVVVKVLPPSFSAAVDSERFRREITLTARWQHPHIVPLLSAGTGEGLLYYIMPLVEGESLDARIERAGPLSVSDAVRILREITDAIAHAHAAGVVHRDIKPANVLLSGRHAFMVDFGVARALATSSGTSNGTVTDGRLTAVGMAMGTPAYMAPEQALGDPSLDHRADLYALGILAFEALTGALPFDARTPQAMVAAHLTTPPPPVATRREGLPPVLAALVDQLLTKEPSERPPSADAVLRVLETISTSDTITLENVAAIKTSSGRSAAAAPAARRTATRIGVAVALVGALGAGGAFLWSRAGIAEGTSSVNLTVAGENGGDGRSTMLVAEFRAPGADSSLGSVATEAVRTALAQSSAVTVLTPDAVTDALTRMQRPVDSRLDATLARELALREGVRAVVDGSVTAAAGSYIVSVRLVQPETGVELAAFREPADGVKDLLPTLDRLTRKLRGSIGESLQSVQATPPLDRVTTASLPALRQYAAGMRALASGELEASERAFRSALAVDSTFAMAYRALGTTLVQRAAPSVQIDSATEQAYRFRDRLPKREQLLTTAAYLQGTQWSPARDRAGAAQAYAGVLALAPNDPDALLDYAFQLRLRRDFRGADSLYRRAIARRATVASLGALASALLAQQQPAAADSVIADGMKRFPASGVDRWYRIVRLHERGAFNDVSRLVDSLRRSNDANARLAAIVTQPDYLLFRGKLRAYEERLGETQAALERGGRGAIAVRQALAIAAAYVVVDSAPSLAVRRVDSVLSAPVWLALSPLARAEASLQAAATLARAGQVARAKSLAARVEQSQWTPALRQSLSPMIQTVQAEIALGEGRAADALRHFAAADSLPDGPSDDCQPCLAASQGRAYERAGLLDSAIAAYERYVSTPDPYRLWYGTWWHLRDPATRPVVHERLAQLYRKRGDVTQSARHDSLFALIWSDADERLQPRVTASRLRRQSDGAAR